MIVTRIDLIPAEAISADIYFRLINRSPRAKTNSCYFYSTINLLPPPMPYIYRAATHLVGIVGLIIRIKNTVYLYLLAYLSFSKQNLLAKMLSRLGRKRLTSIFSAGHPREPSIKNIAQLINMSRSSSKYHARDEQID